MSSCVIRRKERRTKWRTASSGRILKLQEVSSDEKEMGVLEVQDESQKK